MTDFNVLLVEDDSDWQYLLQQDVEKSVVNATPNIHIYEKFGDAVKALKSGMLWHLLITDICLGKHNKMGKELVRLAHGSKIPTITVSGTETVNKMDVAELVETYQTKFLDKLLTNDIHGKIMKIVHQRYEEVVQGLETQTVDFLIITPMEEELKAVCSKFSDLEKIDDYQYRGSVKCDNGTNYNVVISCLHSSKREIGPVQAAAATPSWIEQWQPSNLLLVGIAAGAKGKVRLGDILIPAKIVDVTITKLTADENRIIPEPRSANKELFDKCKLPNLEELIASVPRPEKKSKITLYTGGCVISTSSKMEVEDWTTLYKNMCEKLHGLEMEASGVMTALDRIVGEPKPKFMMIRAVSDFGGTNRKTEQEKWEKYACDVAAAYTYAFLKSGPVPALNKT